MLPASASARWRFKLEQYADDVGTFTALPMQVGSAVQGGPCGTAKLYHAAQIQIGSKQSTFHVQSAGRRVCTMA